MSSSILRTGAVALLDTLGFKAHFKKHGAEATVQNLSALRNAVLNEVEVAGVLDNLESFGGQSFTYTFISDTFVITSTKKADREHLLPGEEVLRLGMLLDRLFYAGVDFELPVRGCVAYGEFAIDGTIIIGDAVFDAAGGMEAGEEAIVWLHDSAATAINNLLAKERTSQSVYDRMEESYLHATEDYAPIAYITEKATGNRKAVRVLSPFTSDFHPTIPDNGYNARQKVKRLLGNLSDVPKKQKATQELYEFIIDGHAKRNAKKFEDLT